jgi:hypothetical protein
MKKIIGGLGLCMLLLLIVGVFVAAADLEIVEDIEEVVSRVSIGDISEEVAKYIEVFVAKREIEPTAINSITRINFDDLPKEVNIENVGDTNLAIYEVTYNESLEEEQKVFVITYSVEELSAQGDLIIAHDKRQFLNFGFAGEMIESGFLETATGVEGSLEKGYVMMREGSITGLSTNLEIVEGGEGEIDIIIYKNGEQVGFGNTLNADVGIREDYDVQSNGVVSFEAGDVISVYVDAGDGLIWKDVITMLEITTTN